jgi:Zn-dependent M28 family amino/carboxypeptidase
VRHLAETIGERNTRQPEALRAASDYIEAALVEHGFEVKRHTYTADGVACDNLEVVIEGTDWPDEIVVVGAHYDSAPGTPGANDNASGTAGLLALARRFAGKPAKRSLRLVAFVNEEPPYFRTPLMGSRIYARGLKDAGANVVAMMSLETIGYYSDEPDSQAYPFPMNLFYPSTGNFVAFIANDASVGLLEYVVERFRERARFPSEGAGAPESVPGVDWSDQQGFWAVGYPGLMVTDTAPNRYPHYHDPEDTPDQIDYEATALVVDGLAGVVRDLVDEPLEWRD